MANNMSSLDYDELTSLDYPELSEYCSNISEKINRNEINFNDLNNSLLFSFANLKRFENYIYTDKWLEYLRYISYDIYLLVTGGFMGLGVVKTKHPELYNAYSPERVNIMIYVLQEQENILTWFQSNLKHFYYSKNIDSAFYFALVSILSLDGLMIGHYLTKNTPVISVKSKPMYNEFKSVIGYENLLLKKLSAKGDELREKCYEGWLDFDSDLEENEKNFFTFVIYCVALNALTMVINNKDELNIRLQSHVGLIKKMIFSLVIKLDKILLGYFSNGNLINELHYVYANPGPFNDVKNFDLTIVDESRFNEIIALLLPLGNKYVDPLCRLIFDEKE